MEYPLEDCGNPKKCHPLGCLQVPGDVSLKKLLDSIGEIQHHRPEVMDGTKGLEAWINLLSLSVSYLTLMGRVDYHT